VVREFGWKWGRGRLTACVSQNSSKVKSLLAYDWAFGTRHAESSGEYPQHVALFTFAVFRFFHVFKLEKHRYLNIYQMWWWIQSRI
jgi:hypothetical protein